MAEANSLMQDGENGANFRAVYQGALEIFDSLILDRKYSIETRINAAVSRGFITLSTATPSIITRDMNISIDNVRSFAKGQNHSAIKLLEITRDLWTNSFTNPVTIAGFSVGKKKILKESVLDKWVKEINSLKKLGEIRESEYLSAVTENILQDIEAYRQEYIA